MTWVEQMVANSAGKSERHWVVVKAVSWVVKMGRLTAGRRAVWMAH